MVSKDITPSCLATGNQPIMNVIIGACLLNIHYVYKTSLFIMSSTCLYNIIVYFLKLSRAVVKYNVRCKFSKSNWRVRML